MHRLLSVALVLGALGAPDLAGAEPLAGSQKSMNCAERAAATASAIQLAQSTCRGSCSTTRGYCLSTCRDSFCRAVCNDRYQSCLASCRR